MVQQINYFFGSWEIKEYASSCSPCGATPAARSSRKFANQVSGVELQ
jgi:hypothetical protein